MSGALSLARWRGAVASAVIGVCLAACAQPSPEPTAPEAMTPEQRAQMEAAKKREWERMHSDDEVHREVARERERAKEIARYMETHRRWRLLVYHAFRPGVLALCRNAHLHPNFEKLALPEPDLPGKSRWIDESVTVTWNGGHFGQKSDSPAVAPALLDTCFTLYVQEKPVMSGAVVHAFSARALDMPTLVIERKPAGEPLALTLLAHFPADVREPVPAWNEMLRGLNTGE